MSWLIGPVVASWAIAYVAVRIFDYIFAGATGSVANAARASVFVSAWTAVTAGTGMRGLDKRVRGLRRRTRGISGRTIDAITRVSGDSKKG